MMYGEAQAKAAHEAAYRQRDNGAVVGAAAGQQHTVRSGDVPRTQTQMDVHIGDLHGCGERLEQELKRLYEQVGRLTQFIDERLEVPPASIDRPAGGQLNEATPTGGGVLNEMSRRVYHMRQLGTAANNVADHLSAQIDRLWGAI